jgi:methionine-rich copper-binding protein CopC
MLDNNHDSFQCTSAYASVVDSDGTTVKDEALCYTDDESAWYLIESDVTDTVGTYYIVWKILNEDAVIYHSTRIEVTSV